MNQRSLDSHNLANKHFIAALRVWRNADHSDWLTLHRNQVIGLLEEIDGK